MILNSPYISGSLTVTGNTNLIGALTVTGSLAGTATSSSFAYTASSAVSAYTAASAVNATTALTASYATSFTVGGTLTAQTLVVQTITSSVSFITGSTRFGSLLTNTHDFTGSVRITGSLIVNTTGTEFQVTNNGVVIGNLLTDNHSITGSLRITGSSVTLAGPLTGSSATFTGTLTATDGTQGLNVRAYTGGAGFGAIYSTGVTAGAGNFALAASPTQTILSGVDSVNLAINSAIKLAISSSGNVGIGTTTPTAKLEVNVGLNSLKISGRDTYIDSTEDATNANIYVTQAGVGDFSQLAGNLVLQARTQGTVYRDIIFAGGLSNGDALMTILGEGNVGIGTTNPVQKLQVDATTGDGIYLSSFLTTTGAADTGATLFFGFNDGVGVRDAGSIKVLKENGTSGNYASYLSFFTRPNGAGLSERMRITSAGNVGIGTASPVTYGTRNLEVNGGAGSAYVVVRGSSDSIIGEIIADGAIYVSSKSAHPLIFRTTDAERMRITSAGFVGIGTTSPSKAFVVSAAVAGSVVEFYNTRNNSSGDFNLVTSLGTNAANTDSYHYIASTGGADRCYVYGNGNIVNSNNSYGTLSDISLKENIIDATSKLADILQLKVRNFNLIGDENKQIGFIAQEFEEVFPSMIDVDGNSGKKAIKTSVLVPILVKAIQELKAELDELKNK